jgi:hyperosmotically inducible periplasmic protein
MRRKNSILLYLLAFSLIVSVSGCKKKPDDAALTQSVQTAVQSMPGVTVSVLEGVVTLSGEVENQGMIAQAEEAAKKVEGIKSVTNSLTVTPPAPVVAEPAITFSPDDSLKTAVEASLTQNNISGVTVTAQGGEITLTGDVKRANLQSVIKAANEAKPKKVNNKLTIK